MRYQITGKQIDIGEALQTHVQTELDVVLEKYAFRPTDAQVTFSKSAHEYICEVQSGAHRSSATWSWPAPGRSWARPKRCWRS